MAVAGAGMARECTLAFMKASGLPPGPTTRRLAQMSEWLVRPHVYARRQRERYGDVFTARIEPIPWVMLGDPDDVRTVFTAGPAAHQRRRGQRDPAPDARLALAAAARRRRAHAPAQADAPGLPRRAHATATATSCARRPSAPIALVAGGRAVRAAPAHAGDHARGHHARRLRRRGRRGDGAPARRRSSASSTGRATRGALVMVAVLGLRAPDRAPAARGPLPGAARPRAATRSSPSAARRPTSPSATTSSRRCCSRATRTASR